MKPMTHVVLGLLALLTFACEKGKFAEQKSASDTRQVNVVDAAGADGTAAGSSDDSKSDDDDDSPSSGKSGSGKGSDETDDSDDNDACAGASGISKDRVHISGSEKETTLTSDQAYSLKVSGSSNAVTLKLTGATPATRLPAVCLFVSGNQNHVILDIGLTVGQIYIKARGNHALIEGLVSKDGVVEKMTIDAKGNSPEIIMKGEGKFPAQ